VFPLKYELNFYILFRRNSVFNGVSVVMHSEEEQIETYTKNKQTEYFTIDEMHSKESEQNK
jgi:hypothetical protein